MRRAQFIWLVSLGSLVALLAVVVVTVSAVDEAAQRRIQAQQVALSSGVLGPQGQQIGNAILQEMAGVAATNRNMRALLKRHGFNVQPAAGTGVPAAKDQEAGNE